LRCVGYCGERGTVHKKAAKRCSEIAIEQRPRRAGTGPIIRHAEPAGVVFENDKDQERRDMDNDNTQGAAEPSLASAGSHGDGMAARLRSWRDERGYPTPGEMLDEAADEIERLRLTDAEREAIELAIETWVCKPQLKATLRGLLERMK
jgi:hypothetical protein